jgi:hypothetical protein
MPTDVRAADGQARMCIPSASSWPLAGLRDAQRTRGTGRPVDAVEADAGPAGRFAPPGVLAAVARLVHPGGPNRWLGLGSGHARLEGARAAAAAGVGPEDLLRQCSSGAVMRLAPAQTGVAVLTVGPVRIWASGVGLPGAWVMEGLASA